GWCSGAERAEGAGRRRKKGVAAASARRVAGGADDEGRVVPLWGAGEAGEAGRQWAVVGGGRMWRAGGGDRVRGSRPHGVVSREGAECRGWRGRGGRRSGVEGVTTAGGGGGAARGPGVGAPQRVVPAVGRSVGGEGAGAEGRGCGTARGHTRVEGQGVV
nr:hypothetical protein [Tanacetum cinerariifolium]